MIESRVEGNGKIASAGNSAPPELIPVKASVFDDDFFQSSRQEMVSEEEAFKARFGEATHILGSAHVQEEEICNLTEEVSLLEPSVRAPFVGAVAAMANPAEPDELDIPAFLRRGN